MSRLEGTPVQGRWPDVTGIVPAAGASERMGEPKGLLELEGRSFLWRVVQALRDGGCGRVVVVVREGDDALAGEARAAGADVLTNPEPGDGPITSLRLALRGLSPSVGYVVWLPLDHPAVASATVRKLVETARTGAAVTLPVHHGERGHPAVFARILFPALLDPDMEGGARTVVHRCLDSGSGLLVDTDDAGVLADVDTPEEYRALVHRWGEG